VGRVKDIFINITGYGFPERSYLASLSEKSDTLEDLLQERGKFSLVFL